LEGAPGFLNKNNRKEPIKKMVEINVAMTERVLSAEETAEVWNGLSVGVRAKIFREMLDSPDKREKPNFTDYIRGTPVKFEQLQLTTKNSLSRYLQRKGKLAIIKMQHPEGFPVTQEKLLDQIYRVGAVVFNAFRLKLHEKNPEEPLSPIRITLRRPPEGPLTEAAIEAIGRELYRLIRRKKILFDLVVGIPRAGEPFADVVSRLAKMPLLKLGKKTDGGVRKIDSIVGGKYQAGQLVLLVDDLVTKADTKKEAIEVCEKAGLNVVGIVVFLDRQQGGSEELREAGYNLYSVFTLSALLDYYVRMGMVSWGKRQEVMAYIGK
jgi:orotate phosphoribosyltransferase